jgi:D-alanyl-D-alanine carboxypeptidase
MNSSAGRPGLKGVRRTPMRKLAFGLILAGAALACGQRAESGQAGAAALFPGRQTFLRPHSADTANPYADLYQTILNNAVKAGFPGLAVYIRTPEEGVWIGTGGYADLETRARIQPESLFYSASHLKIFTATAIMMLWDAGLIDLEATIDRYLPADISSRLANAGTAKIKDLLNHTSGIPNYTLASPWGNDPLKSTWRDDIESILDEKAEFTPESRYSYCNTEFVLLAVIIDQIAGDHADFLSHWIFQPLGMTHTYYRKEAGLPRPPFLITPYQDRYNDGALESVGAVFPTIRQNHAYGAGGLLAGLADYARFSEALFGGELISPAALQLMSTPQGAAAPYGYGFGMIIKRVEGVDEAKYGRCHGHGGRGYFGSMEMNVYPNAGVTLGYATNYGSNPNFMTPVQDVFETLERQFADAIFNRRTASAAGAASRLGLSKSSGRRDSR